MLSRIRIIPGVLPATNTWNKKWVGWCKNKSLPSVVWLIVPSVIHKLCLELCWISMLNNTIFCQPVALWPYAANCYNFWFSEIQLHRRKGIQSHLWIFTEFYNLTEILNFECHLPRKFLLLFNVLIFVRDFCTMCSLAC